MKSSVFSCDGGLKLVTEDESSIVRAISDGEDTIVETSPRRNCYHAFETSDYCRGWVYGERRFLPANNGRPPTADAEFPSPLSLTLRIRLSSFPK